MAKMVDNVGKQAQALAKLWGRKFGNIDFKHTLGEMKTLLNGNKEKGLAKYKMLQIRSCIEWLAEAEEQKKLKKKIQGPGAIRWVIKTYIAGGPIEDTFLCYQPPEKVVRML